MKRTCLMLLMLLLQLSAFAQTPIPINGTATLPDSIKGQGWIQNYVQKAIKDAGGVTPGPGLDSCNKIGRDPKIIEIRDVTTKGLVTLYDAENVYKLNWVVSNLSGQPLRSGILEPNNNVPSITFNPELPAGIYNLTYTAASCLARYPTTKSFNVNAPPIENPECPDGPTINKLLASSATSVQVQHHSVGVNEISWWIVNDRGAQTQSGWFTSTNNSPVITFTNKLDAGTYTLWFSGHSCVSKTASQIQFTVSPDQGDGGGDGGGREPAVGVFTVVDGYRPNMDLEITGEPGNLIISDKSEIRPHNYDSSNPQDGYTFTYMVNGHVFRQNTPLKNYAYKGLNPLRVVKGQIRKDISENDGFNRWSDRDEPGGYYITGAGNVFPRNESWPVYTAVVTGVKGDFINPIPGNYDPSTQYTQWADLDGGIKLPAGHIFNLRKGEWPYQQIQNKGVTHLSNYDLPWGVNDSEVGRLKGAGLTYNDVPTTAAIFKLGDSGVDDMSHGDNINWRYWPTGELTEAQAISAAENADAGHAVWVGETVEGNHRMPADKRMWYYFYKTLRAKYERDFGSKGIPYYIAHNYFQLWSPESVPSLTTSRKESEYLKFLTLSKDQLPRTDYSTDGTLSYTNMICEGVYLGAWDVQRGGICKTIYRFAIYGQMGFYGAVFLQPQHESRPNNYIHYPYTELDYYDSQKIPLDPNTVISYAFISQIFGKGYVLWGDAGKASGLRTFSDDIWTTGFAQDKQGKDVSFPYRSNKPTRGYLAGSDMSYFGTKLFSDTYGKVEGGKDQWLDFRIDGGTWVSAKNFSASDAVSAFFGTRGFVHSRTKNGITAWFYLNEWADNLSHKLEVRLPSGTIKSTTISGNGIHARVD